MLYMCVNSRSTYSYIPLTLSPLSIFECQCCEHSLLTGSTGICCKHHTEFLLFRYFSSPTRKVDKEK